MNPFHLCSRDGGRRRPWGGGGVHYGLSPGDARPTEDGKRRLIRGEGFASRVSGTVRPQDPGGGTNDVSDTAELSRGGGGGLRWSLPEFRWCWSRRPMLGTLHDGSVHVTIKRSSHWLARTGRLVGLCLRVTLGRHAGGGGRCPLPALPGGSFRLMLRMHQLCLLRDLGRLPRGFRWCWSMGLWLGTLQDGSVRLRTGIGDRGLARRGRLVCL